MKKIKIKETKESNFNIVLFPADNDDANISDFLDVVSCDENYYADFKIVILYAVLSKNNIEKMNLKLILRYLPATESEKSVTQIIIDDNVMLNSYNSKTENGITPKISRSQAFLPKGIITQVSGRYIIHYSSNLYKTGNYQFELYYKYDDGDDYVLANIQPFVAKEKVMQ